MLEYLVIALVALFVSCLTFFSGFGLGTLLMPAFALFFSLPVAIAATAIVHLINNLFKVALVGKHANWSVVLRFTFPAVIAAMVGATLLLSLNILPSLAQYQIGETLYTITPIKFIVAILIIGFSLFDLIPALKRITFDKKYLFVGGLLSGFFGGLTGHQGACRTMFLIKSGLDKQGFIGTNVVSAAIVDVARILVYGTALWSTSLSQINGNTTSLVVVATVAAAMGTVLGSRLLKKITLETIQYLIGTLLIIFALALGLGII